ncbi:MAG: hypothetical protein ACXACH_01520 [Candidatus Hermodarchaeia archaeon]|jgi:hypothetical protein
MHKRNIAAMIFALIGGVLLIATGYYGTSTGFWGWAIQIAISLSPNQLISDILVIVLLFLAILSFLGGWTVLIGCLLLPLGRHRTAVHIIGIGAGMSLMGLLFNLVQMYLLGSLDLATFLSKYQSLAWVAVIFTIIARELIRYGKDTPKEESLQEPQEDDLPEEVPEESHEDPDASVITDDEGDEDVQGGSNSQTNSL